MRTTDGRKREVHGAESALRRGAPACCALVALAIFAACEDREPPGDVERTRTGGVNQVPRFATPDIAGGAAGVTAGTRAGQGGVSGGPQGEGGFGGTTVGGTDINARNGAAGTGMPGPFGAGAGGFGGLGDVDGDGTRDGLGAGAGGSNVGGTATDAFGNAIAGTGGAAGSTGIGNVIGTDATNLPPTASFEFSPQCVSDIQTEVTLTSTSVDPDGDPLRCEWTMPAGIPNGSSDCSVTATFFNAGESPVVLIVDDGRGGIRSATREIAACSNLSGGQPAELPP